VSRATSPALHLPVVYRKVLAEPYAETGKGLKPDMDNAVAVVEQPSSPWLSSPYL
jgi:hypothetical protein